MKNLFQNIKMGKEISTSGKQHWNWKKIDFTIIRLLFLGDVDTAKVLVSTTISFGEKTINTLLVTCKMVTKLNY